MKIRTQITLAVGVRDDMQLIPSYHLTTGPFCHKVPKQKSAGVGVQRLDVTAVDGDRVRKPKGVSD